MSGPPADMESTRQRRGRATGRIHRGAPTDRASRPKGTASIPTKFETIINPFPKERDGFMSSTQRFSFNENGQPGPGAYFQQATMLNQSTSISKKGFGSGFVSKHERFTYKPQYTGPGPGEYNSHVIPVDNKLVFNRGATTSAFATKSEGLGPPLPKKAGRGHTSPGPQAYYPSAKRDGSKVSLGTGSAASSAFKAQSHEKYKKDFLTWAKEQPGPGTHDVSASWGAEEQDSTAFRHATNRFGKDGSIPKRRPPAMTYGGAVDGPKGDTPGPGAYDSHVLNTIELAATKKSTAPGRLESPAFVPSEIDRFGRPVAPRVVRAEVPGPGRYEGTNEPLVGERPYGSHLNVPASSFNSTVGRKLPHEGGDFHPPGPAYYSPEKLSQKRTFHLNQRKYWMGI